MKIKYIVPELYNNGGIQEFAKSLYSQLKDKFELELLNWENDLSLPAKGILKYSPAKISSYLYSQIFSNHFRGKYAIEDVDLIHFWHPEPAMAFLDKKYIVTCHGTEILPSNIKGFRKILYPKVLHNAILIHANSNYTKNLVMEIFDVPSEKIKVINPPIEYSKLAKSERKANKDKIIIGTLTRFNRRKNVPNVIKALNILKEKYNVDFEYYLVGAGIDKKRIMDELKKAKFEWEYFGEISEEEKINKFYPSLDVFVMPSLALQNDIEGFGIAYLEANAYGIPVVASKTGGVPDAVKEGISGELADPTNPEDIAEEILRILIKKDKYRESAKKWAVQFDIKKIAKSFSEIYDEQMKRR